MTEIRDVYTLSNPMSLPEGVAFDSKSRRFFATGASPNFYDNILVIIGIFREKSFF